MLLKIERSLSKKNLITLFSVIAGSIIISSILILITRNDSELGSFFSSLLSDSTAVAAVTVAIITTLTAYRLHKSMRNSNKKNASNDENYTQITRDTARQHFYSLQSLTIGLILWLIAEFTWTYYQLVVGIANPFPSTADGFWLAGYPLFLYFVFGMTKAVAKDSVYDREALILISTSAGLALAYIFSLMFGIQDLVPSIQDRMGWTISLLYPIFDTIVLVPSLVLIGALRSRKEQSAVTSAWLLMAGSIVVVTLADIAFSYSQRMGEAAEVEWFADILYSASYIFMAGGLYWYYRVLTIYSEQIRFRKV
jgi:hypothetical protein